CREVSGSNVDRIDSVVAARANLEGHGAGVSRQDVQAVEGRAGDRAGDLLGELLVLGVEVGAVLGGVGGVGRLHRELAHALGHLADLAEGGLGGLRERDAVVGIADRDVHAADLGVHPLGDREAGGVVLGTVDAQAGRQALYGGRKRTAVGIEVALGIQRHQICVDHLGHRFLLGTGRCLPSRCHRSRTVDPVNSRRYDAQITRIRPRAGGREPTDPEIVALMPWRGQRSRLSTVLGMALACDSIATPACWSTWARVIDAVSAAKSASMIRLRAAVWLSTATCRFEITDSKRFWAAP